MIWPGQKPLFHPTRLLLDRKAFQTVRRSGEGGRTGSGASQSRGSAVPSSGLSRGSLCGAAGRARMRSPGQDRSSTRWVAPQARPCSVPRALLPTVRSDPPSHAPEGAPQGTCVHPPGAPLAPGPTTHLLPALGSQATTSPPPAEAGGNAGAWLGRLLEAPVTDQCTQPSD